MSVEADGDLCLGRIPSSPSVFSADEYRAWLSRAPSTSAIYERIRARDSLLRQQKAAQRFTFSAENLPERTRQVIWPNLLFYSEFLKRQQKIITENVKIHLEISTLLVFGIYSLQQAIFNSFTHRSRVIKALCLNRDIGHCNC